jgi:ankyrin repeat protein
MDRRLLEAATSGDVPSMKQLLPLDGPGVLLGTTPQGNTCLHVASIQGHEDFCKNILTLDHSPAPALLSTVNKDGETPLLTAVARAALL